MKAGVIYMPVLHQGYINYINSMSGVSKLFLVSNEIAQKVRPSLAKDLRSIDPYVMAKMLSESSAIDVDISVLSEISQLEMFSTLVLTDDEFSRDFCGMYFIHKSVEYVDIFLRWDSNNSTKNNSPSEDFVISRNDFDQKIISACREESRRSGDWWRQVGGCIVKNGQIIISPIHNKHVPSHFEPYFNGDPRANFRKGENIEIGTAMHVELNLVAMAAEIGLSLAGSSLYVTTFPCPWCAKAIAYSGIQEVYFEEGYSVLDAQSILQANNIKIIRVVK